MLPLPFILQQAGLAAPPLLIAGFGELIAERAGLINIGIEGTMLMGAASAFAAAALTGSPWPAIPIAIAAGLLMAVLFAIPTIWFRADQIVTGTAINIFAAGASATLARLIERHLESHPLPGESPHFDPLSAPAWAPPALQTLLHQYAILYITLPFIPLLHFLLQRTRPGLIIRALGDNPDAADAAGIRVRLARTAILLFAGSLSGLAGAYLSTMRNHAFQLQMTAGQGFLVLALVIFARWNIALFTLSVLAFSLLNGLQSYLTTTQTPIPRQLFDMLPYLATLAALLFLTQNKSKTIAPIFLARPWPEDH